MMLRSADFQSAVSPSCTRQALLFAKVSECADAWQIANLRYSRVQLCTTPVRVAVAFNPDLESP